MRPSVAARWHRSMIRSRSQWLGHVEAVIPAGAAAGARFRLGQRVWLHVGAKQIQVTATPEGPRGGGRISARLRRVRWGWFDRFSGTACGNGLE